METQRTPVSDSPSPFDSFFTRFSLLSIYFSNIYLIPSDLTFPIPLFLSLSTFHLGTTAASVWRGKTNPLPLAVVSGWLAGLTTTYYPWRSKIPGHTFFTTAFFPSKTSLVAVLPFPLEQAALSLNLYLPVFTYLSLFLYLYIYLLVSLFLSISLSLSLSLYLSTCLFTSLHLSLSLSTCLFISLYLSLSLSTCLFISLHLSLSLSIYLSIYPSINPSQCDAYARTH